MVVATREKVECGCGSMIGARGQMMHETSKKHQDWANLDVKVDTEASEEPLFVAEPIDSELEEIMGLVKNGSSPFHVAKAVRSIFNRRDWPNAGHPGNMVDWLNEHGVPVRTMPRHVDPDEANRYQADWLATVNRSGWGTPEWDIKVFNQNWNAFLRAQEEEIKRLRESTNL